MKMKFLLGGLIVLFFMMTYRVSLHFPQLTNYISLGNVASAQQNATVDDAEQSNLDVLDERIKSFIGEDDISKQEREEEIDRIFKGYQDYIDLAPSEVRMLYALTQRRLRLDQREKTLYEQEATLRAIEQRLAERSQVMEDLNNELKNNLAILDKSLEVERKKLRDLYANMKAAEAATIFDKIDDDTLILLINGMAARVSGPILAKMDPEKVKRITQTIAESNRKSLIEKLRDKERKLQEDNLQNNFANQLNGLNPAN